MHSIELLNYIISIIFAVCYSYQFFYIAVPFFRKFKKTDEPVSQHRFAALICARNEEIVIGNLIESIKRQSYPAELIKVFVAADNCTDRTAQIARDMGAVVYERFDKKQVGKGYALKFLLESIEKDGYNENIDAFLVFDADNLVDAEFVCEMNKVLAGGANVATCYRNTKNFGDNWISAGYALWFIRESKFLNGPRNLLGSSAAVSGTGFMFSKKLIEKYGGWNFFTLTEDIEFTIKNVTSGEKIAYCPTAIVYDEQPTRFSQSWRQRMRWSRGYLQVFAKYGKELVKGIFRGSFACFDMSMTIMPAFMLSIACQILNIIGIIVGVMLGGELTVALLSLLQLAVNSYLVAFVVGFITTITEWKKINTSNIRKIFFSFTFPIFMFTYVPITLAALFGKVTWKPIEHKCSKSIDEIGA